MTLCTPSCGWDGRRADVVVFVSSAPIIPAPPGGPAAPGDVAWRVGAPHA